MIVLCQTRHVLKFLAVEHLRLRRVGYVEQCKLKSAVVLSAVSVITCSVSNTEQTVIAYRYEQGGEAVDLDFAFDNRLCRVRKVDYEQRVDRLIGDNIGLVTDKTDSLYALVSGKSRDFSCFFKL